eukprot:tig00000581_g2222.t1
MGNAVDKCQDVKKHVDYQAADGNDAAQAKGVIEAALKENFDFQGHPSDFRAIDANGDNTLTAAELESFFAKQGITGSVKDLISVYDATKARSDAKFANGDGDGKLGINEWVNCGGHKNAEEAQDAAAASETVCPCDIPKCPSVRLAAPTPRPAHAPLTALHRNPNGTAQVDLSPLQQQITEATNSILDAIKEVVPAINSSEENVIAAVKDIESLDIVSSFTRNPNVTCSAGAEEPAAEENDFDDEYTADELELVAEAAAAECAEAIDA